MSFPHRPVSLFNDLMTVFTSQIFKAGDGFFMKKPFGTEGSIIFSRRVCMKISVVEHSAEIESGDQNT